VQSPGAPGSTEVEEDDPTIVPHAILDQPDDLSEDGKVLVTTRTIWYLPEAITSNNIVG